MHIFAAATIPAVLFASNELLVLKTPDILYVRSAFSDEYDVLISMTKGVNDQIDFHEAALVKKNAPMNLDTCQSAEVFQTCIDDAAPWKLNGTYIGANHGWHGIFEMTVSGHGWSTKDIGLPMKDEGGSDFYVIKILDANTLWVMPDNAGDLEKWRFAPQLLGTLADEKGRTLKGQTVMKTQLAPACRILRQTYLVDGKTPLQEGVVTTCQFLDVIDEYDIVNPAAVISAVKRIPGRIQNFVDPELDVLLTNTIRYQFQPWGACTVRHTANIRRAFTLNLSGFIQSRTLLRKGGDIHRYYIPDTRAFSINETIYDFGMIQDFPGPPTAPLQFGASFRNIDSPDRLPSRFIQILSKRSGSIRGVDIGYALGYSLLEGCSVPAVRARNCARAAFIHTSAKTYPIAMDEKLGRIEAGTEIENLAYRQYFSPGALSKHATAAYLHREGEEYILYADYHQQIEEDVIELPKFLLGRSVKVIDATASVELLSGEFVSESGIRLAVKGATGHIAIAISPRPSDSGGPIE